MKYLVFGDIHGKRSGELEGIINAEKIDSLICLGDFDQVKAIRSFMDLEKKFIKEEKPIIVVPGNHDYAVFHNDHIHSRTLEKQGKSISELHSELQEDSIAKEYIFNLINRKSNGIETKIGLNHSTYVVHGGLDGNSFSYLDCPKNIEDLWFRVNWGQVDYPKNFKKMEEKGYDILIRGHDHQRMYGFEVESGYLESLFVTEGGKFELVDSKRHVINPGAWFEGDYLIIDDSEKNITLDYKNLCNR